MDRQVIFVVGYPKSGTTWLTRLLADSLNCPSGGSISSQDDKEPASEGWDRPGPYIVRKGHFRIVRGADVVVPAVHQMCLEKITTEKTIFLVRDPRDIAVSAMFYHEKPLDEIIAGMIDGSRYGLGPWAQYVHRWAAVADAVISYEQLIRNTMTDVLNILYGFEFPARPNDVAAAVERQSFDVRRAQIEREGHTLPMGMEQNLRLMRKGTVGEWRKHFNSKQVDFVMKHWRYEMEKLGYEC